MILTQRTKIVTKKNYTVEVTGSNLASPTILLSTTYGILGATKSLCVPKTVPIFGEGSMDTIELRTSVELIIAPIGMPFVKGKAQLGEKRYYPDIIGLAFGSMGFIRAARENRNG